MQPAALIFMAAIAAMQGARTAGVVRPGGAAIAVAGLVLGLVA